MAISCAVLQSVSKRGRSTGTGRACLHSTLLFATAAISPAKLVRQGTNKRGAEEADWEDPKERKECEFMKTHERVLPKRMREERWLLRQ